GDPARRLARLGLRARILVAAPASCEPRRRGPPGGAGQGLLPDGVAERTRRRGGLACAACCARRRPDHLLAAAALGLRRALCRGRGLCRGTLVPGALAAATN